MTNYRRLFREQARTMNWEYAVVEHLFRGQATVVIEGTRRRLTTIPVVGENIEEGDRVIVDYSAEIPAVKRISEGVVDPEYDLAEAAIVKVQALPFQREDKGIAVGCSHGDLYPNYPVIWPGIPWLCMWGLNDWPYYNDFWGSGVIWDTNEFMINTDHLTFMGPEYVELNVTGTFYIRVFWNMGHPYGAYTTLPIGMQQIRLLKDGTTPLLEVNQRHEHGYNQYYDRVGIYGTTIERLDSGDRLSLEFTLGRVDSQSDIDNEWLSGYFDWDYEEVYMAIQLVPGSEE